MARNRFSIPTKIGGLDVDFAQVRSCIGGSIARLFGDRAPADITSRLTYLHIALEDAEKQLALLVETMKRHDVGFADDE